jgi:membrane-bound lytic murein transglycosylase A
VFALQESFPIIKRLRPDSFWGMMVAFDYQSVPVFYLFLRQARPVLMVALWLTGCATAIEKSCEPQTPKSGSVSSFSPMPPGKLALAGWDELKGWQTDSLTQAWPAFLQGCEALRLQAGWAGVCQAAQDLTSPSEDRIRHFFETRFQPYQISNLEGQTDALITGYYEPLLHGSTVATSRYVYPLYGVPADLLVIDLSPIYPELKNVPLRGRLEGNRIVPYYSREDITGEAAPLQGRELYWVDDPIELLYLQIQGSGRLQLEDGRIVKIGYADQNGHSFRSVARLLIDKGELTASRATMRDIKEWARRNPEKLAKFLNYNPSYVFFRELPSQYTGPIGTLGVPLSTERSLAVDPRVIPLGAPVFLQMTWPIDNQDLNRLMLAQDTGGAIKGAGRADFFWGYGQDAERYAENTKQKGKMWVLLPKTYPADALKPFLGETQNRKSSP